MWKEKEAAPPGIHVWSVALPDTHTLPVSWPGHLSSLGFSLPLCNTRMSSYSFPKGAIKLVGLSQEVLSTGPCTGCVGPPISSCTAIWLESRSFIRC